MRSRRIIGRMGGTLAGATGAVGLMVLVSGGQVGSPIVLLVPILVAVIWPSIRTRMPRRALVDTWPAVPSYAPASTRPPASSGQVAVALAGPEARELALSPAFGAGIALCATVAVLFGVVWPEDSEGALAEVAELTPAFVHPLVGMVLLAAHRARSRSVRDGTEELLASCPTSPSTRTAGHLVTAWLPLTVTLAFGALMVALISVQLDAVWGPFGARQWVALLSAGVLAVGGTAVGVALGRWAPWTIVPIVALVAIAAVTIELATAGGGDEREPLRQLSTMLGDQSVDLRLTAPHYLARLGWLVALTVVVVLLALLKDRRTPVVVGGIGLSAVAAAVFGWAAVQPIDAGDARRIAAVLNDLPAHQSCTDAGGVAVCTFEGDGALARLVAAEVAPVAAAAPDASVDGLALRAGATYERRHLDPEVIELLEPADPALLPVPLTSHPDALEASRLWVGLAAVGAIEPELPRGTAVLADQARGVVALWLATRGTSPSVAEDLTSFDPSPGDSGNPWRPWPDPCYGGAAPVQWGALDVQAARVLLDVPAADVEGFLEARWAWVTDPATTTGDLLGAFGLDPVAVDGGLTRVSSC